MSADDRFEIGILCLFPCNSRSYLQKLVEAFAIQRSLTARKDKTKPTNADKPTERLQQRPLPNEQSVKATGL
jgi:hypothetical protein